jgi:hypothetical protein
MNDVSMDSEDSSDCPITNYTKESWLKATFLGKTKRLSSQPSSFNQLYEKLLMMFPTA